MANQSEKDWARIADKARAHGKMIELSDSDLELVNGATDVRSGNACCSVPCFGDLNNMLNLPAKRFGTITPVLREF